MLGDIIALDFSLSMEAILLSPLVVTATARPIEDRYDLIGMEDFYRRYSAYSGGHYGEFLTRDSIAKYDGKPITAGQMMSRTMMRVSRYGIGSGTVSMVNGCDAPQYWVNGTQVWFYPHWALMPEDLEAVEIYEFPFLPPGLSRAGPGGFPCGVVSIWTRRVPDPELSAFLFRPKWRRALTGIVALSLVLGVALIF